MLKGGSEMDPKFILQTVVEVVLAILVIVAFVNEKKLIAFEDRILAKIKKKFARK